MKRREINIAEQWVSRSGRVVCRGSIRVRLVEPLGTGSVITPVIAASIFDACGAIRRTLPAGRFWRTVGGVSASKIVRSIALPFTVSLGLVSRSDLIQIDRRKERKRQSKKLVARRNKQHISRGACPVNHPGVVVEGKVVASR